MLTIAEIEGMDERAETALIALRRILRATELNSRLLVRHTGLTTSQFVILQRVAREGKVLPSTVAKSAGLTQATVTSLVDKLERNGFVMRRRDTADRRRIWIALTAAGKKAVEDSPDLLQDRFQVAFRQLADWEQAMIIAALERVSAMLDAGTLDASPILDIGDLDRLLNPETPAETT